MNPLSIASRPTLTRFNMPEGLTIHQPVFCWNHKKEAAPCGAASFVRLFKHHALDVKIIETLVAGQLQIAAVLGQFVQFLAGGVRQEDGGGALSGGIAHTDDALHHGMLPV